MKRVTSKRILRGTESGSFKGTYLSVRCHPIGQNGGNANNVSNTRDNRYSLVVNRNDNNDSTVMITTTPKNPCTQ